MRCSNRCSCSCGCSGRSTSDIYVGWRNDDLGNVLQATNLQQSKLSVDSKGQLYVRSQGWINEGEVDIATVAPVLLGAIANDSINTILSDNGGVSKLLTDLTRRLIATEFPVADERHGNTALLTATGVILGAQGAGYRLVISEYSLTNMDAAAKVCTVSGSLGTGGKTVKIAAGSTQQFTFPKGLVYANNEALQLVVVDAMVTGWYASASGYLIRVA